MTALKYTVCAAALVTAASAAGAVSLSTDSAALDFTLFAATEGNLSAFGPVLTASNDLTIAGEAVFGLGIDFDPGALTETASGYIEISDDDGAVLVGDLQSMSYEAKRLTVTFGDLSGSAADAYNGQAIAIFDFSEIFGGATFDLVDGMTYDVAADIVPAPLPASALLLVGGLAGLGALRRR